MAVIETQGINLEGIEDVFRICGKQTGMAALEQRITEYVKAHDSRILNFLKEMEKYDKPRLQGSPGSDKNNSPNDKPDLNYFAPKKILQDMLLMEWFDEASADKKKFTKEWRNQMLEELMVSDCRDEVAKAWANKDLRLQVKGHVMGAMTKGGAFLKKKYTPIARIYYGTREDTKESITLAKYMGEYVKTYYGEWIKTYVERS